MLIACSLGSDGHRYVLDVNRITPRDLNFTKMEDSTYLIRFELMGEYLGSLEAVRRREIEVCFSSLSLHFLFSFEEMMFIVAPVLVGLSPRC